MGENVNKDSKGGRGKKDLPAPPPTPTEKEEGARKEADANAEKDATAQAQDIATEWAKLDSAIKGGLLEIGRKADLFFRFCAKTGCWDQTEAAVVLNNRIAKATGEDKSKDLPRALQVYYSAVILGESDFARLSIRGQKEFAACTERGLCEEEGVYTYTLKADIADKVKAAFAFAVGSKAAPAHLKKWSAENRPGTKKSGDCILYGQAIAQLLADIKAGFDPLSETVTADMRKAKKDQGKGTTGERTTAGTKDGEGETTEGKGGEETATGDRPPGSEPFVRLDPKPVESARLIAAALQGHEEKGAILCAMGQFCSEVGFADIAQLVMGLAARKSMDDIRRIAEVCSRELFLFGWMAQPGNASKTRADAMKVWEAQQRATRTAAG